MGPLMGHLVTKGPSNKVRPSQLSLDTLGGTLTRTDPGGERHMAPQLWRKAAVHDGGQVFQTTHLSEALRSNPTITGHSTINVRVSFLFCQVGNLWAFCLQIPKIPSLLVLICPSLLVLVGFPCF